MVSRDQSSESPMTSFGANLRRERELRGISLREISDSTKFGVRFLEALEQDRVELLPGGLFRRTLVRQYARHVGLDPERTVADFVYANGGEADDELSGASRRSLPSIGTLLVLAALLGLGVVSFLKSRDSQIEQAADHSEDSPTPPPATQPGDRVYPQQAPLVPRAAAAQADQVAPREQGLVLTLSAQQSCWVSAQVDGQPALNRILNEGESETLEAQGEIVLSVGNAGGLSVSVNDKPGVPLGRSGEVKRNIVITRKSLPTLVPDHSS
jgi:cytoskeletal protein RodZ